MKIETLTLGPVGTNCYIVYNEGSEEAVVIDSSKKRFNLSGVFENLREGNYTFRIYCQFGYGKSSIYSHQGRIGEAL